MSECDSCKNKKDWPCQNSCGYMGVCDGWEPKPTTNADKLRSMSDEELADWLAKHNEISAVCPNFGAHGCQASCRQCWLDWLRQEAKE